MFIYQLEGYSFNEETDEENFDFEYIIHERNIGKEEFEKLCEEALGKCKEKYLFRLKDVLIKEYGFSSLPITQGFQMEETD